MPEPTPPRPFAHPVSINAGNGTAPTSSAIPSPTKKSPTRVSINATPLSATLSTPSKPPKVPTLDAPTIYKQIRSLISPKEFEDFAHIIAEFNAGKLPANETLDRIKQLVKDEALVIQMEVLIQSVLDLRT